MKTMTPQSFLLAIAQHPAGKYAATTAAISQTWSVYFGGTTRIECSGYPGRFRLWHGDQMNEFVVIENALDAVLEILEPPRVNVPPGFVAVDAPTISKFSDCAGPWLAIDEDGVMRFENSVAPHAPVTWLAVAPPVVSDGAREWLRGERVRWDERTASYRAISEIARALGGEP